MTARVRLPTVLTFWALLLGASCGDSDAPTNTNTLKVGVLLPYTGESAALGRNNERALLMALERIAEAGVAGKTLELVYADTGSDPERAEQAVEALLEHAPRAIIGPKEDELAAPLAARLAEAGVLLVSAEVLSEVLVAMPEGSAWYRLAPTTEAMAAAFAQKMVDRDVAETKLVLSTDTASLEFGAAFSRRFRELGGSIGQQVYLPVNQLSYATELAALPTDAFNEILLAAPARTAARVVNELATRVPTHLLQLYLVPELRSTVFVESILSDALEGALGISPAQFIGGEQFVEAFRQRFFGDEPMPTSLFYFDALVLVAMALERAHQLHGEQATYQDLVACFRDVATPPGVLRGFTEIAKTLTDLRKGGDYYYAGVSGPFSFDNEGKRQLTTSSLWTITNRTLVDLPE